MGTRTTAQTITAEQCWALASEAAEAGDAEMVETARHAARLLERALDLEADGYDVRDENCVIACARAIGHAEAQRTERQR